MALFYQQNINESTRLGIWHISEGEDFFLKSVPLQNNITHPHKRLQHLAGRYLLPYLFPHFPYQEIEIAHTRKPFLPNEEFHFSISHCADYAAAIVSATNRVGIDAEMITPRIARIKSKFLHADEMRFVNSHLASHQLQLLTLLWSAKEAVYKWYGLGEVDFSEMIRILPFTMLLAGDFSALFLKNDIQVQLHLHYKIINEVCLVWVISGEVNASWH